MQGLRTWWVSHSQGERRFMAGLGLVALVIFLWLGVWRPVNEGITNGWARQSAALDRYAAVRDKVVELKQRPKEGPRAQALTLDQLIGQSAAEAGFALERANQQGEGRLSVNIASARIGPLLQWIADLESNGVAVQTISIVPGATEGTVTMQAVFQGAQP